MPALTGIPIDQLNPASVITGREIFPIAVSSLTFNTTISSIFYNNSVKSSAISALAVTTAKIDNGAVTTAKIADSNVTTTKIADNNVTTAKIADNNVTTAKIADSNVTAAKIANSNVTSAKIADSNITTAKIADSAVTTGKIADSNITTAKIANSNITTAKIADSNITTAKIADNNVTTGKIANNAITSSKIAENAVGTSEIADNAITTSKILDGSITTSKIINNSITTAKLQNSSVTADIIANSNVTTAKIADNNVTTAKIADNAITSAKIANNAVGSAEIDNGAVGNTELSDSAVTTSKIADSSITAAKILNNAITTAKIADDAVTALKLANNSVATANIINDAVTPAKLSTDGPSWGGGTFSTNTQAGLELGPNIASDTNSFIDFHSAPGGDYDARVWRRPGANGNLDIYNQGTGSIHINQVGSGSVFIDTNNTVRITVDQNGSTTFSKSINANDTIYANNYVWLSDDPVNERHAVTKQYVDTVKVSKDGDVMSGPLTLTNDTGETNYLQFPDGSQQFTAAEPSVLPRAWVNFNANLNSSGVANTSNTNRYIRSNFNISSVTKLDSGRYQINFKRPLKNSKYILIGNCFAAYDGTNASNNSGGLVYSYDQQLNYAKIVIDDPTSNSYANPNLANLVIYGTDEADTPYPGGGSMQVRLEQSSGDVWRMYGKLNSTSPSGYTYKINDGYGWSSGVISSTSESTLISINNTGRNNISLLTVQVLEGGEIIKTYDIARNFNTFANINGSTTNIFTVTTVTGTASPDATYSQVSNTIAGGVAKVVFNLTLP